MTSKNKINKSHPKNQIIKKNTMRLYKCSKLKSKDELENHIYALYKDIQPMQVGGAAKGIRYVQGLKNI